MLPFLRSVALPVPRALLQGLRVVLPPRADRPASCRANPLTPVNSSPGADDDGSGTVTTLEAFRALVKSGWEPATPVEFHWFSAEEGGLLGSQVSSPLSPRPSLAFHLILPTDTRIVSFVRPQAIAQRYAEQGTKVKAMIQMDMTAWVKAGTVESVGVITDFVDPALTEFNKQLVDAYLDIPWVETKCGYACSGQSRALLPSLRIVAAGG